MTLDAGPPQRFQKEDLEAFFNLAPMPSDKARAILADLQHHGEQSMVHHYMLHRAKKYRDALTLPLNPEQKTNGQEEAEME